LCIHKGRGKKVEVCPGHATKAYGGVKVKLHLFLTLTLDGGDLVGLMHQPLYPQAESSQCLLNTRLGGPQGQSGQFGEVKNPLPLFDSNVRSSIP